MDGSGTMAPCPTVTFPARPRRARRGWRPCRWGTPGAPRSGSASGWAGAPAETVLTEIQQRTAEQLFRTLGELKGGAMKFGQALSVLEAALPEEIAGPYREQLTRLQDAAPPMPTQTVRDQIAKSLGPDWQDQLVWLDGGPTAAASHRPGAQGPLARRPRRRGQGAVPRRRRGADVRPAPARPGSARTVAPLVPGVDIKPLIEEMQARAVDELDYELEAEAQRAFAEAFRDDPDIVVPDVVARGGPGARHRVAGEPGLAWPASSASGTQEERDHYGELFVRFLFAGPRRTGMLHADPHPGNFRILPNDDGSPGRLGILDFGAVARLESKAVCPRRWAR